MRPGWKQSTPTLTSDGAAYRRSMGLRTRVALVGVAFALLVGCSSGTGAVSTSISHDMAGMTAASSAATGAAPSRLLAPADFEQALAEPNRVSIDVHIPFEGKIAGTDLIIPYNEIAQHVTELPADKSTPLAIYCRSGNMSAIAAPELKALGYNDIVELSGGMDAWKASGRTLLSTP